MLFLHGFTGTPFELDPLAQGVARLGYAVETPLLIGHGGTLEELARTRWPDWLQSAEAALDDLVRKLDGARVAIVGFSMGGLLALRLARLRPRLVAALVIMAAPLRLRAYQATAVRALVRLPAVLRPGPLSALPKLRGYDVVDEEMKRQNPGQVAMPVVGVASLLELGEVVRRDLSFIKVPTLVVHGERDRTVPLADSFELAGSIGSDIVERLWLPRSGHLVAIDVERSTLIEFAGQFLRRHLDNSEKASDGVLR